MVGVFGAHACLVGLREFVDRVLLLDECYECDACAGMFGIKVMSQGKPTGHNFRPDFLMSMAVWLCVLVSKLAYHAKNQSGQSQWGQIV